MAFVRSLRSSSGDGEKWGTLMAIDLKAKGKILWQQKTEDPLIGGVSVVVFGLADGWRTVCNRPCCFAGCHGVQRTRA